MTSTSKFGYYVTPYEQPGADTPMSTATARWIVNNARHLIDQSTQTRVNYVALKAANCVTSSFASVNKDGISWWSGNTTWKGVASFVFPVCLVGSDTNKTTYRRPSNLIVSLAGYTESAVELFFRIVIQSILRNTSHDLINDQCLAYWEDSTTSNTSEWIIDGVTTALYPDNIISMVQPNALSVLEYDSNQYDVLMYFLRMSIYAKGGLVEGDGHITGVYVRECQL